MKTADYLLVFSLEKRKYALNVECVERIIPSVSITPLPGAPTIIRGVIKLHEKIVPIANIHKRFEISDHEINLSDQIIIADTGKRIIGLLVDSVHDVIPSDEEKIVPADKILKSLQYVEGIVQAEDGLIIIHNLEKFLSLEEVQTLDNILTKTGIENV
ncbi:MAG: chemotaxis protein CheW [Bacteroidota bacterium]